ncbi:hypothetical protein [Marinobacter sp.]|uniref:hypothetical protein n=1 Tax=Marinobacter sp. TaxID=50741 RepID=UPI003B52A69F
MFGSAPTSIIIVYPKGYYEIASKLKHEISKLENLDSTIWSTDQYRDNIPTLSGKSHVIFLGDGNENEFVKPYYGVMKTLFLHQGACFGFDGTKAIVFGLDNSALRELASARPKNYVSPENQALNFNDEISGLLDVQLKDESSEPLNRFSRFARGALAKASEMSTLTEEKFRASATRRERATLAVDIFLKYGLDAWTSSNKDS